MVINVKYFKILKKKGLKMLTWYLPHEILTSLLIEASVQNKSLEWFTVHFKKSKQNIKVVSVLSRVYEMNFPKAKLCHLFDYLCILMNFTIYLLMVKLHYIRL